MNYRKLRKKKKNYARRKNFKNIFGILIQKIVTTKTTKKNSYKK